jgi:hypothetical protein
MIRCEDGIESEDESAVVLADLQDPGVLQIDAGQVLKDGVVRARTKVVDHASRVSDESQLRR